MKRNMGAADRVIRLLVATVLAYLYFGGVVTGTGGIILLVVAGVFVLTSLVGNCPLYSVLGIRTCPLKR